MESISALRHSARGCLNAVKLCVSALELDCTVNEQVEFLDDVINSSEKLDSVMEELDLAFEQQNTAPSKQL